MFNNDYYIPGKPICYIGPVILLPVFISTYDCFPPGVSFIIFYAAGINPLFAPPITFPIIGIIFYIIGPAADAIAGTNEANPPIY